MFFFNFGFLGRFVSYLTTNAVSDLVLWTTGNREADQDKTHDILEKCLRGGILD